jgi:hypothetical protein
MICTKKKAVMKAIGRLAFNAPVRRTLVNQPITPKLMVKKNVYQLIRS